MWIHDLINKLRRFFTPEHSGEKQLWSKIETSYKTTDQKILWQSRQVSSKK